MTSLQKQGALEKRSLLLSVLRWTKRIGLGLLALVLLVAVSGIGWEHWERAQAQARYRMQGKLVDIGGRRIHIDCRGHGVPIVVFENGLDTNGVLTWSLVHDQIARTTRACAYDRAGFMWSDDKPGPHDADGVARDLHATLAAAGERGPYVLVGHSLGGPYVMDYTRLYPRDVAGVVFVDATHPDQIKRVKAAKLSGENSEKPPLIMTLMADLAWTGLPRLMNAVQPAPKGALGEVWTESRAFMPQSFPAMLAEFNTIDATLDEAGRLRTLGSRPLVVLTATKPLPPAVLKAQGLTPDKQRRVAALWKALQMDEASWSTHSRRQEVPDASHYIQFDRPDIVIAAVTEVVAEVRAEQREKRASQ